MPDWKKIYERHSAAVWRTAWRILRDHESAAECVQETFLTVMMLSLKEPVREWEGVLISLTVRRALDQLRVKCRDRRRQSAVGLPEIRSADQTPDQTAAAAELADRLRKALTELPPQQAEVFCLRAFNDLSYGEIATHMGLAEQHVGVLLHRARQSLQHKLKDIRPRETSNAATRFER